MSLIESRREQIFPVLDAAQMKIAQRFAGGPPRAFAPGEDIFHLGERRAPAWLILEGEIEITRHDGLKREAQVVSMGAGQFTGEMSELSGRGTLAAGRAGPAGCTALPFDSAHLRALIVGSAELGEMLMRAFILRRVGLLQTEGAGSVLIGQPGTPDLMRLQNFLSRNGYPCAVMDVAVDGEARALVERTGVQPEELPVMVCPNGAVLKRPTDAEAGMCLGITPEIEAGKLHDVVVVGAGPAGLATAVYAASEGLSVLVLDHRSYGGQAGASARIENYLGFPTGISGTALAGRAYSQAQKFGAEVAIPLEVKHLDCGGPARRPHEPLRIELSDGRSIHARTVVVASGARYRQPNIPSIAEFEGAGVSYWASAVEAKLCEGEEIALIGGGNSAGQAVVFLAPKVKHIHVGVRRGLENTMSRYLVDRIAALPNVSVHTGVEVVALEGDQTGALCNATFRGLDSGKLWTYPLRHLFLFIGAEPNGEWLATRVAVDGKGFVITGQDFAPTDQPINRAPLPLETSVAGVFAIGDVRAGSTKRFAAAVGEGAAVVAQIHAALAHQA
ncbi:MAG: thioredoxin reductase [Alphaproteobacteria bacterium]|jgi:thioredoxin reductase (NADPH)|nr:thioredoxin reductase [Alphaproteobacteria bacterium]